MECLFLTYQRRLRKNELRVRQFAESCLDHLLDQQKNRKEFNIRYRKFDVICNRLGIPVMPFGSGAHCIVGRKGEEEFFVFQVPRNADDRINQTEVEWICRHMGKRNEGGGTETAQESDRKLEPFPPKFKNK